MAKQSLGIGVIGLGTVGASVADILARRGALLERRAGAKLELVAVCDRGVSERGEKLPAGVPAGVKIAKSPVELAKLEEVDVVVELIGGLTAAREAILAAIEAGKPVVTANKHLLALHGDEVFGAAEKQGVYVGFEAAVAGGIPILNAIRAGIGGDEITAIRGIMNGTANYILTEMSERGLAFETVLRAAQEAGYAEADPTFDIEGIDAAHKLAILAGMAFGTRVDFSDVFTEGISHITPDDIDYARGFGYDIKLLGIAAKVNGEIELRVHPVMLRQEELLGQIDGPINAIEVHSASIGTTLYTGPGAGGGATAGAVVSDLVRIGRALHDGAAKPLPPRLVYESELGKIPVREMGEIREAYYLRFTVKDQAGVLARIATVLGEAGISIAQVLQPATEMDSVPVIIMTHHCREADIMPAVKKLDATDIVLAPTVVVRIQDENL